MKVSDIFAFALSNADYWNELLTAEKYPPELTPEEVTALDAAREHLHDGI